MQRCWWVLVVIGCSNDEPRGWCDDTRSGVLAICVGDANLQDAEFLPASQCILQGPVFAGCSEQEKCAWLEFATEADPVINVISCFPLDGTEVGVDEACMSATQAPRTSDNCERGLHCLDGRCRPICMLIAPMCGPGLACTTYPDLFLEQGIVVAGVCQ